MSSATAHSVEADGRVDFGALVMQLLRFRQRDLTWIAVRIGRDRSAVSRYIDGAEPRHHAGERLIAVAAVEFGISVAEVRRRFAAPPPCVNARHCAPAQVASDPSRVLPEQSPAQ